MPCGSAVGRFCVASYIRHRFPEIELATESSDRELLGHLEARHSGRFCLASYIKTKRRFAEIVFGTEPSDLELLGRLVARHSAVFVLHHI